MESISPASDKKLRFIPWILDFHRCISTIRVDGFSGDLTLLQVPVWNAIVEAFEGSPIWLPSSVKIEFYTKVQLMVAVVFSAMTALLANSLVAKKIECKSAERCLGHTIYLISDCPPAAIIVLTKVNELAIYHRRACGDVSRHTANSVILSGCSEAKFHFQTTEGHWLHIGLRHGIWSGSC